MASNTRRVRSVSLKHLFSATCRRIEPSKSAMAAQESSAEEGIDMLEAKGMALIIFTVLNILGVGFLLYVLANFWKEGHKPTGTIRAGRMMSMYDAGHKVVVARVPIGVEARRENDRLIRFPIPGGHGQQHGDRTVRSAIR
jgi:hypothetical protein